MAKKSFVKGAAILGAAGLFVKILGALFRIPLGNMVSATSMAYFQPAYLIYTFFVVIATSGIPVAISRMVSERVTVGNFGEAHRAFKISMYLMLSIGILSFILLFFGAGPISEIMNAPKAKYPMMVVAPALIFVPTMAAYRGYFQGLQNMIPTAISQVIEQVFRVVFGLSLAYFLYHSGEEVFRVYQTGQTASDIKGAVGAISGATVGSLMGLVIILWIYFLNRDTIRTRIAGSIYHEKEDLKQILRTILIIAVPITIGATIMPIMGVIEVPIINNRLAAAGFSLSEAEALYGTFSGYVISIINLPQVLTAALAMSLVPMIASLKKEKDYVQLKYSTTLGMRIAMMIGLPCAFGLAVLAKPIMMLLYPTKLEMASVAAGSLAILAIGVIFLSIIQTLTAILQGVGKQMIPVINLIIAIVIKIVVTYILTGNPDLNIKGAAIGTVAAYLVASILNIRAIRKYIGVRFEIMECYIKPAISAGAMAIVAFGVYKLLSIFAGTSIMGNSLATVAAIGVGAVVYILALFISKSISREDLVNMPKGEKLLKIYDKVNRI